MSDIEYSVIRSDVIKSFDCICNFVDIPILIFLQFFFLCLMFSLIFTNMKIRFVYQSIVLKYYDSPFIWYPFWKFRIVSS